MATQGKKSVAIIGEGETEWFYFDAMRVSKRYPFKLCPGMPKHSDIKYIIGLAQKYIKEGYDYVVCLVDMDVMNNETTKKHYIAGRSKLEREAKKNKSTVLFVETSPCTEFWFLLHFLPNISSRDYKSYEELLPELQRYMPKYEKTKRYFVKTNLYKYLIDNGDIEVAIRNSKKIEELAQDCPENKCSYSQVYKIIELLNELAC